jgi:hypothetical protein
MKACQSKLTWTGSPQPSMGMSGVSVGPSDNETWPVSLCLGLRAGPQGLHAGVQLRSSPKSDSKSSVDNGGTSGGVIELKCGKEKVLGIVQNQILNVSMTQCCNIHLSDLLIGSKLGVLGPWRLLPLVVGSCDGDFTPQRERYSSSVWSWLQCFKGSQVESLGSISLGTSVIYNPIGVPRSCQLPTQCQHPD